ncbi:MAG: aminotransferase class I/II-fold pyridoxal phosphate-dependent enzyme [Rhizobiales bacterium]|nr:aminotransferase class I/II-fold pyridoxal phosphate-dependent enzyme [Hyphomicrobiales bacterium]
MSLKHRGWVPDKSEVYVQKIAKEVENQSEHAVLDRLTNLAQKNKTIHEIECFNLNPATNVMNPKAEQLLASGLGSRPSLGYPNDKYEMGLEAIEEIEVISAQLCAQVFDAKYAEIRVGSGALANLYGYMATCKAGDVIIVPPASIGGHVTHHLAGCAGLFGLKSIEAPVNADGYSVDIDALEPLVLKHKPKLITIGGSLNLFEHPVKEIRQIADLVGAKVMFDAAHQCGIIAGKAWRNPLNEGAHFMTMSTYKSLGGPAGGLIVTNDAEIAERLDAIAYPGMTANFDAAKSAALGVCMLDWKMYGEEYAQEMITLAQAFAKSMAAEGLTIYGTEGNYTNSHQFAMVAKDFGGGQTAAKKLRKAGFLACGIGLPIAPVDGDLNGLRFGTPELVRWGVKTKHIEKLAYLIAGALKSNSPEAFAPDVRAMRSRFNTLHYII